MAAGKARVFLYTGLAAHIVFIGMPIAWLAQRGALNTLR